jgi:hypothetical protein
MHRKGSGPRLTIISLGVVMAIAAVMAASATALKTKSASSTVAASAAGALTTAKCKKGSEAVSGGFDDPSFDPTFLTGGSIFHAESHRAGKRKWTALPANSGQGSGEFVVYAYCDKSDPGLKKKSATVTVPQEDVASVTVRCKRGSEVLSGGSASPGFDYDDGPSVYPFESRREGKRKWTVSAYNFSSTVVGDLTAFAYCDKSEPGLKAKSSETAIGTDLVESTSAKCKKGTEAVSGGFDNPDFDPTYDTTGDGPGIYPYESRREGKRTWSGSAYNDGESTGTFAVFAYCAEKQ